MTEGQAGPDESATAPRRDSLLARARRRGVPRVAASYALIAWLLLQIADVTFEPLGIPKWVMTSLIVAAALGFPVAVALAWFYEIGDHGVQRDTADDDAVRPVVHGKRRFADLVIIGVLLATVAVLVVRQSDLGKPSPPANPAIAVLAFENLSGDPAQEYFSDGLAVEVLDRLGRVPGLKVIASSSSFSYKGKNADAKTIASQLGVTTVLEGSVRRSGNKLKLNAKLIDGATGLQLWSGSFDREVTDVFAMQAELAAAVIDAIVPTARGDTVPAAAPTLDLNAHDHYLLGLAAQRSRSDTRLAESITHLEQAVALDPSYAQAHAALARSLLLAAGYLPAREAANLVDPLGHAEKAVFKALALDPSLSDAHGAYGNLLREQGRSGAEDEYRRALELNPNNAIVAHDYGVLLSLQPGREAEVDRMRELTLRLDPRSAIAWTNDLGHVLDTQGVPAFQKRFAEAMQVFAGDPDGLGTLALANLDMTSFPFEAYQVSHQLKQAGVDSKTAVLASLEPLNLAGAYDESLARIDRLRATGQVAGLAVAPREMVAAGLKGDFERLERVLNLPQRSAVVPQIRYAVDAFWYSVQGRFDEAEAALAKAGEIAYGEGGFLGTSLSDGGLSAMVRLHRARGRNSEADALIQRFEARLRKELGSRKPTAADNVLLAEVALASGERSKAVRHLQTAMQQEPVPYHFYPQLPWFRSLEGEPGYAAIVAELEERRAAIRKRIAALDAQNL